MDFLTFLLLIVYGLTASTLANLALLLAWVVRAVRIERRQQQQA